MDQGIRYIFSINTGRSGSHYLATLFEHVSGCRSFHEPQPIGNAEAMRRFARGDCGAMERLAVRKAEAICGALSGGRVYHESNHCFIKGFGWFISRHLPEEQIGVIILKRDKAEIAASLLRIGCSPLDPLGWDWILTPDIASPLVTPPIGPLALQLLRRLKSGWRRAGDLCRSWFGVELGLPRWLVACELKCLGWYVDETHARAEAFKRAFPLIRYYEVSLEELNDAASVRKMMAHFGCQAQSTLKDCIGRRTNLKIADADAGA
ncbi:MAG TPA: hypothetical protein VFY13_05700 [Luteolibacter sp.]|nr:hypothetical protein [Luteolibacter sp.]